MTVRANSEYIYTAKDRTARGTRSAQRNFDSLRRSAVALGSAFISIAGVQGIGRFIASTVSAVDELGKLGKELDTTTQFIQEARFATQRQGGTVELLDRALRNLRRRVGDAAQGNKEYADSFAALNITAADFANLSLEQLFEKIVQELANVENASQRTALSFDVFGRASEAVNRIVAGGIDEFRRLRQVNRDLGGSFSDDLVAQAEAASDAFEDLGTAAGALATRYTSILLPAITGVTNAIAAFARLGPQGAEGVLDRLRAAQERLGTADTAPEIEIQGGFDLIPAQAERAKQSVESLNGEIRKTVEGIGGIDPSILRDLARFQQGRAGQGPGGLDLSPENVTRFLQSQGRDRLREERDRELARSRERDAEITERTNALLEQILAENRRNVPLTAN